MTYCQLELYSKLFVLVRIATAAEAALASNSYRPSLLEKRFFYTATRSIYESLKVEFYNTFYLPETL